MRNLPWKVVKSIRLGGGRISLAKRRGRGGRLNRYFLPKDAFMYAVLWDGNPEEGFPVCVAGGWDGQADACKKLYSDLCGKILEIKRLQRSSVSLNEQVTGNVAQNHLFSLIDDVAMGRIQGPLTVVYLGDGTA